MDSHEILSNSHDHIMANTWRLIFERNIRPAAASSSHSETDFAVLAALLPEYRLIGLCLADTKKRFMRH